MESTRHDLNRYLFCTLQWSTGAEIGRYGGFAPWVEVAIDIYEACGVVNEPAACVGVDASFGAASVDAENLTVRPRWEELEKELSVAVLISSSLLPIAFHLPMDIVESSTQHPQAC